MARLIYSAIASLDGYVEDASGGFAWAAPDEELHVLVNDLERPIGTYLYGRRMYETMASWQTAGLGDPPLDAVSQDYAELWRAAEKVVFSTTLGAPVTPRTRVEPAFEASAVGRLKDGSPRDLSIGGPGLAGQALAAGLVDECHLFLHPVLVGGGKRALPANVFLRFELLDERHLASGVVHLQYRVLSS